MESGCPFADLHGAFQPITCAVAVVLLFTSLSAGSLLAAATTDSAVAAKAAPWWKHALVYEIYPRSFQDTNGDGVEDINGIIQRLDYLQSLKVNAIWLTPIYPSPQVDFGYDISNYEAIDPLYGSMADFDCLIVAAPSHHTRVIMDMVMNHTSDQSPWFIQGHRATALLVDGGMKKAVDLGHVTLPPFAVFIGSVQ